MHAFTIGNGVFAEHHFLNLWGLKKVMGERFEFPENFVSVMG
tara:strand:+ start:1482 stop:1607 length:126 start_codon:yes stop_codon:yes gene_type:complete